MRSPGAGGVRICGAVRCCESGAVGSALCAPLLSSFFPPLPLDGSGLFHTCYGGVCDCFQGCPGGLGDFVGGKALRSLLALILPVLALPDQFLPEFGGELPPGQELPGFMFAFLLFYFIADLDVPLVFPDVWNRWHLLSFKQLEFITRTLSFCGRCITIPVSFIFGVAPDGSETMGFDFTIALVPDDINLNRELQYIKSALLYADSITLISPVAYIFQQLTNEAYQKSSLSALKLFQQMMPLIKAADMNTYTEALPVLNQFSAILRDRRFRSIPYVERLKINRQIQELVLGISDTVYQFIGESQCTELTQLIKTKQVKIAKFQHTVDDTNATVQEYIKHLNQSLSTSYPLYDEQSSNLMRAAVNAKIIQLSPTEKRKITHAGVADSFIQRLPCFDSASMDELIDIKKELSSPLIRFRSKMLDYSDEIQSLPWDGDFENECNLLYDKEVVPSLLEIKEATRENSFLKNLGGKLLTDEDAWKSTAGMVVAVAAAGVIPAFNQALSSNTTILAAGGAVAISRIASSYAEYIKTKKEIEKKDLYFYFKAGERLNK